MLGANVSRSRLQFPRVRIGATRILRAGCALALLVLITALCAALVSRPFGYRPVVVTSGSMGHSIPVGSLAITHPVSAGGIRDGDVILVHEQVDGVQARPKMHRVIRIEHDGGSIIVSTKGDANPAPDPSLYVLPARVDVVAFSLPFLGYLVSFLLTPAGWLLVVGLPGALACAFVLRRIWSGGDPARPVDLPATGLTLLGGSTAAGDVEHESRKLRGATGPVHAAIPLSLRPSLMMTAVVLLAITTSAGAAAGYLMASRSTTSDGAGRLTQEALSLTQHSAHLATGDAYAADLLLLRDAEDPALGASGRPERDAALARLLAGPSNVFDTLAVIDPAGHVIASTDPTLVDVQGSAAVRQARANAGVASSVDESADGSLGTIDFAAPLRAPNGAPSGVLFAHVTAAHLWAPTLQATVDGSRNVIVDAHGVLVAGPANELGHPWNAAPAPMGGLRASVDGSASVCGSSTIGEGTPLDMGLRVASCLPNSLGTAEGHTSARRELGGIAFVAAVVVAVVLFASIVYVVARQQPGRAPRRNTPTGLGALAARLDAIEARLEARDA